MPSLQPAPAFQLPEFPQLQAFSKGAQQTEAAANFATALAQIIGVESKRRRELKGKSELADIIATSGAFTGPAADPEKAFRTPTSKEQLSHVISALAESDHPANIDLSAELGLKRLLDKPDYDPVQMYPPRGSGSNLRARVVDRALVSGLAAEGWTTEDMRQAPEGQLITGQQLNDDFEAGLPVEYSNHLFTHIDGKNIKHVKAPDKDSPSALEERITLFESMEGVSPERARMLALKAEVPIFDQTSLSNRLGVIYRRKNSFIRKP